MAAKRKLQARRRQKPARKPLSHWLRPAFVVFVVGSSVTGLAMMLEWMKDPDAWPVKAVQVEGDVSYLGIDALQSFLEPMMKQGFFSAQVGEIQSQLQARPWVEQVSVRRVWPNRVQVHITEQRPVARWGEAGFLNPRGEYFSPQEGADIAGLPRLDGPDGYEQRVLSMFAQMRKSLRPLQLEVIRLQLDARRAWHVRLDNGLKMELGRRDPLRRVERFIRAYPAIMAEGNGAVESVDLRYSNGVAVHWQSMNKQSKRTG